MVAPITLRQGQGCPLRGNVSLDGRMRLSSDSSSEVHGPQSVKHKDLQFLCGVGKSGDHPVEMPSDDDGTPEGESDVGVVGDLGAG